MQFKRFEEMKVWQEARTLTTLIYQLTSKGDFRKDFGLKDQIQRSAVSVMSNIAEGYERLNRKEFILFLGYAKGSTGGVRCQLYVARDLNYITEKEFEHAYDHCVSISTQLSNFIRYLKSK